MEPGGGPGDGAAVVAVGGGGDGDGAGDVRGPAGPRDPPTGGPRDASPGQLVGQGTCDGVSAAERLETAETEPFRFVLQPDQRPHRQFAQRRRRIAFPTAISALARRYPRPAGSRGPACHGAD